MSKVVFSSLFFFHRITVKPSPRQLDLGALLANFLHKRTLCSVCAIFFFFLPSDTSVQALLWFKGLFFCFRRFECCCFFFFHFFYFFLLCFMFHESNCLCSCWQSLPLFSFHFFGRILCLQNLFSCIIKDSH